MSRPTRNKPVPGFDWGRLEQETGALSGSRPLDSVTTRELADRLGISKDTAARRLQKMVSLGKMRAVPCSTPHGGRGTAYIFTEKERGKKKRR